MQRYVMRSSSRIRLLALSVCVGFLLCSCGRPRVDTGITGQVMQCPDGPHNVLNCSALFDQYKRDFAAGLKLFQSLGTQVNAPVHTLIQLDTLTGELMTYRRSLCISYNSCALTREDFVAEEQKLMALQFDLRKAVGIVTQQGPIDQPAQRTQDIVAFQFDPFDTRPLSSFKTEKSEETSEFSESTDPGQFSEFTEPTAPGQFSEFSEPADAGQFSEFSESTDAGQFSEFSEPADAGQFSEFSEPVGETEGTRSITQRGVTEQFTELANILSNRMKAIMRGKKDSGDPPGNATPAPTSAPLPEQTAQHALIRQVETVVTKLTTQLAHTAPHQVGSRIVVGNIVDKQLGYETPFSRYLATLIDTQLSVSKQYQVVPRQVFHGTTVVAHPKDPKTLAKLSGAQMVLYGDQAVSPQGVMVQLTLLHVATVSPLASARTLVSPELVPAAYPAEVTNAQMVKHNTVVLQSLGPQAAGSLHVQVWTDRGGGSTYYEGEKIHVYLQVSEESYVRLFYIDADNNIVQIFPNAYHPQDRLQAGKAIPIPAPGYGFNLVVTPPFGVEQIAAIVSDAPFPEMDGQPLNGGRKLLTTSMRGLVTTLQKHTVRDGRAQLAWDSVLLTTISRGRQTEHTTPPATRVVVQ